MLTFLSGAVWQLRFERTGPDPDIRLGPDFSGWTVKAGERFELENGTWTLLPPDGEARASAECVLPGLEDLRFVRVRLDAAWEDVEHKDGRSWWSARVSLAGKDPTGRFHWPADGDLINASGSRGWHTVECVLDLPPDMGEPHLFFNNLAATGTLKVRDLTVTPVKQRGWIVAATVALLAGWTGWAAAVLGHRKGRLRQAAASLGLVAAGWFLVFPQPNFHARPLPGGFLLGKEIAAAPTPAPPKPVPALAVVPPQPNSSTSPMTAPAPAPALPKPSNPAPPVIHDDRADNVAAGAIRKIDQDFPFAHVAAFFAVGLAVFAVAGVRDAWPLATGLAVLSEVVPNLLRREFMADDAADLVANLTGLALGALLVTGTCRWWHRRAAASKT